MSTNCLVTKLKGTVSADLEKYGELLYEVPSSAAGKTIVYNVGAFPGGKISIEGSLELWDYNEQTNYGSNYNIPSNAAAYDSVKIVVNGAGVIRVENKYNMVSTNNFIIFPTKYGFDMKSISYWLKGTLFSATNFDTRTNLHRCPLTGSFNAINYRNLPLANIELTYTDVIGDLSDFAQYADTLTSLAVVGTQFTGDVADLGTLTHLTMFSGYKNPGEPQLTGTVESFVAAQRTAGRETASNITMYLNGNNNCYFNGAKITTASDNNLSWTATTITFNGVTITA